MARDQLVALRQGMHAVPNPLLGRDGLRRGVEHILSLDLNRVVVLGKLSDDPNKAFAATQTRESNLRALEKPTSERARLRRAEEKKAKIRRKK